jgi:hypothetical protein
MERRSGLMVLLALSVVGACNGRWLPDGFSSSTAGASGSSDQTTGSSQSGAGGATSGSAVGGSGAGGSGAGGSGAGGSGAGGSDSDAGALNCDELAALYVAAVEQDKSCDPISMSPPCQLHVIPSLCVGCRATTYVNSTAASSAARLRWDKVPCPVTTCSKECGTLPTGSRCVPTSDGGAHCVDIAP